MNKKGEHFGKYVRRVHEESSQLARDLLAENERLRSMAAGLESEKARLEKRLRSLEAELGYHQKEQERLNQRVAEIEAENRRFAARYFEVEQQTANLANLYVASYRLHGTLSREEVLSVIQEIIINMIGSEELGVFEVNTERSELSLILCHGLEPGLYQRVPLGMGVIGRVALTGVAYLSTCENGVRELPREDSLTACIPLKIDGSVTGAIAVFRLLQQKNGLDALDHELFDLLATHAATALYCTRH